MKQVIAARVPNGYDVVMYECQPVAIWQDEIVFEHGRWYVTCGGEGHYFMSGQEACDSFVKLHLASIQEVRYRSKHHD